MSSSTGLEDDDNEARSLLNSHDSTAILRDSSDSQAQHFNSVGRGRYVSTALLVLCMFLNFTAFFLLAPFYPQIVAKKKGGAADTEVGVVLGSINFAAFISAILFGKYVDRIGPKFLVVAGAVLVGGSTIIFGFVGSIDNWIVFVALSAVIRFVMGVGEGAFDTTSIAVAVTMFPAQTATVWSLFEVAAGLGVITGPPLGGFLYETHGFLIPFVVVGSIILVTAVFLFGVLPTVTPASDQTPVAMSSLLKMPPVLMAVLSIFWSCAGFGMLTTIVSVFLDNTFHWSPTKISTVFLSSSAIYGVSAFIFGRLADATKPRVLLIAGLVAAACGNLLIGPSIAFTFLTSEPWMVYVGMGLYSAGASAIQVSAGLDIIQTAVARGYKENLSLNGCVSGLVMASTFLGQAIGSPVGGALTVEFGFRYSTSFMAFIMITQVAVSLIVTLCHC